MDYHVPVMAKEVLEYLEPKENKVFLDCTLGGGGHTKLFLKALNGTGAVYGIDRDKEALIRNEELLSRNRNFKIFNIPFSKLFEEEAISFGLRFDAVLMDLGVSSRQIDSRERGFSFREDAKLDMRMGEGCNISAYEVVNEYSFENLRSIFYKYGEERLSSKIAGRIVDIRENGKIETTLQLKSLIESCVSVKQKVKSVSRIFQAIRIEVNNELNELEVFLKNVVDILNPKGRVAIISYHSLEDRIVKNFIKEGSTDCICPVNFPVCRCDKRAVIKPITRKALLPTESEIEDNSRARSAKMRVFEKV
ncbi:MAG: 16S rRNA (cytosine(1402)-N(4))-methyltransferase [Candidatus Cloacimonadota bacterium]|nr:MAG: 16S rRNA (cytosine(1402)-N(4))-methyltransferase [Candidatus Cloacimonadota bacterium]PIE77514.1 MAG: 16S rRNA (cytosine(1402)-N(4))-methyltransferase [Candidatus Delongbacteria bacterium]